MVYPKGLPTAHTLAWSQLVAVQLLEQVLSFPPAVLGSRDTTVETLQWPGLLGEPAQLLGHSTLPIP